MTWTTTKRNSSRLPGNNNAARLKLRRRCAAFHLFPTRCLHGFRKLVRKDNELTDEEKLQLLQTLDDEDDEPGKCKKLDANMDFVIDV